MKFENLNIQQLNELLKTKQITAVELSEYFYERSVKAQKELNCFITLFDKDIVMEQAKKIDEKGDFTSLLAGIPYSLKDNIAKKGWPMTCGSKILSNYICPFDSQIATLLEKAGAVLFGKANLDELAAGGTNKTSAFGAVRNPINQDRISGGSSGGSAAMVGAGAVVFSIGSETGGSIRQPSSYCGVTGIKSTYGTISRNGVMPLANSLDQAGPIANNIEDLAIITNYLTSIKDEDDMTHSYDAIGKDYSSHLNEEIIGKNIAIFKNLVDQMSPEAQESFYYHIENFKTMGVNVNFVEFEHAELVSATYMTIMCSEAYANFSKLDGINYGVRGEGANFIESIKNTRTENLGDQVKTRIMAGSYFLQQDNIEDTYNKAFKMRTFWNKMMLKIFETNDVIMMPATNSIAPLLDASSTLRNGIWEDASLNISNFTGMPGLSVPVYLDGEEMPYGVNIIANLFEDEKMFPFAKAIQEKVRSEK